VETNGGKVMKPIKIGIIGCGGISRAHARGYQSLTDLLQVNATCDVVEANAAERGQQLGAKSVYTDYKKMLKEADIDAVDICLPHDIHAEVSIAALEAGKHVIVEKPIATTLAEADSMISSANKAGMTLMVGLNERYDPAHERIKQMIDDGTLGKLLCIRIDHNQNVVLPEGHWIRSKERLGGGVLIGSGIHRVDLLRWFGGEVTKVANFWAKQPDRMEGEVAVVMNAQFESGCIGEVTAIWAVRKAPWYEGVWVYGTEGSIYSINGLFWDSPDGYVKIDVPEADSMTEELRHFGQCILSGKKPLTNGEEARRSLEVVLAAYRSAESGKVVDLPME
jgi:UDP-N-acetyl-2-amino-2-deoxyglucuronate dehydrogenase